MPYDEKVPRRISKIYRYNLSGAGAGGSWLPLPVGNDESHSKSSGTKTTEYINIPKRGTSIPYPEIPSLFLRIKS